jgi:hypothetical protein
MIGGECKDVVKDSPLFMPKAPSGGYLILAILVQLR